MSAAEKLRALEDDDSGWLAEGTLRNALPQIVAVVEVAETLRDSGHFAASPLEAALAALDEALS